MKRNIYLEDIPLDEARRRFEEALGKAGLWGPLSPETVPVSNANGRVTAEPVWAKLSSPHYNASAMDGFAVRARDTIGAAETQPVVLTLHSEHEEPSSVMQRAFAVDTGQPLPDWADAVVMVEDTQICTDSEGRPAIAVRASVAPWRHVRMMGEDMVASELVIPSYHHLRPVDLGAIAGSGHDSVSVIRRPIVAIIPTGSELVDAGTAAKKGVSPGSIIEYNSIVLAAQVEQWGGIAVRWPIVADEYDAIREAVLEASQECDLVLVNAGSSAGRKDYTVHIIDSVGQLLVHGIAVRPGHPVILGVINKRTADGENHDASGSACAVIGVPGYP
ncbi:MAG: molybdopterin-binding protein, partial [Candidatus Promineifilaceae bacterium]